MYLEEMHMLMRDNNVDETFSIEDCPLYRVLKKKPFMRFNERWCRRVFVVQKHNQSQLRLYLSYLDYESHDFTMAELQDWFFECQSKYRLTRLPTSWMNVSRL